MEQKIDVQTPKKIYKYKEIWTGTFLGGPLVAGYYIAENFKAFEEYDKAKRTWIYTIISTIVIFGGIFLIPNTIKIPNQIIPFLYTGIAGFLAFHYQDQQITAHINSGGQIYSWWRTIGVALIGLAIILISIFSIAYISESATNLATTTKTYGIMKHEIAFDKSNISESEIDKLADGFITTTFFDKSVSKYIFVKKVGNSYEISISCVKSVKSNSNALAPFVQLKNDMQTLFPDNKIIFNLVVDKLDNVVKRLE
jgi:hypothetical protein